MAALAQAFVKLRPDLSGFKSDADRGLRGAGLDKLGEQHGKAFGTSFTKTAGGLLAGVGGLLATIGVASFFKDSIAEAREAVKVGKITEAAIRSTGGAAKISAGQIGELATALSNKVGVDDEAIQSGENLLLTFTRVRNEAGKGNDIFNQASAAIVDMTAAMNNGEVSTEGLKTSTIQVGKALQDPIKGITALARVGVTFSAQQKEQIQNFVASGNVMGAQKVILKELATEFGGTAAAAADPARKAAVAWKNLEEQIGGLLLPVLARLGAFLTGTIIPAVQQFVAGLQGEGGGGAIGRFGVIVRDAFDGIRQAWNDLSKTFTAGQIKVLAVALGALAVAVWAVTAPVSLVVVGIAALVVAFGLAYQHSALFRQIVDVVVAGLRMWADYMLWAWHNVWVPAFLAVRDAAVVLWSVLGPIFSAIGTAVLWLWQTIIYPSFQGWALLFQNVVGPIVLGLWHNAVEPAFQAIAFWARFVWQVVSVIFELWVGYLRNVVGPTILGLWHNVVEPWGRGMIAIVTQVWANLQPIFAAIGNYITDRLVPAFQYGVRAIGEAWNGLREAARAPVAFVVNWVANPLIRGFNRVAGAFGVKTRVDEIGGFAAGGHVRGPGTGTSDQVPIWASNGEYVIPARTVRRLGVGFFDQLIGRPRPGTRRPGDGSEGIAFALGGLIDFGKDIWATITDPTRIIKGPAEAALRAVPGGGIVRDIAVGAGRRILDAVVSFVTGGGGGGGDAGAARAFLLAQEGKPYGWAQAGPSAYDCSGIVSAVWNILHGRPPYSHTFSTSNQAGFFPKPGLGGVLNAGWANAGERGGGSVGHTAAILAGLPFESTGGRGVHIGAGVTPITNFAHVGHYDTGGPWPSGTLGINTSGRTEHVASGDTMDEIANLLRVLIAAVERVAPGVGREINGAGRRTMQMVRAY